MTVIFLANIFCTIPKPPKESQYIVFRYIVFRSNFSIEKLEKADAPAVYRPLANKLAKACYFIIAYVYSQEPPEEELAADK
ncbi:MAG: hypothetical protein ACE5GK_01295 [Nitrospiria bacterium]